LTINFAKSDDEETWNTFVASQPGATSCHCFGWYGVIRRTYRWACRYLYAAVNREWIAVLPLVYLSSPLSGRRPVSLPYLDQGGIVATSAQGAEAIRNAAFCLARELGATGIDFRGSAGGRSATQADTRRFRFLLPLERSEEGLWRAIGPKVRNQIRKSEKSGLETRHVGRERLGEFYAVLSHNMRDLGSPVHSRRFFSGILDSFGSAARLYLTFGPEGVPVAGAVSIAFRETVAVPWASSLRSARPSCPNHSLYWRILRDARQDGASRFDFGRSSAGTGTFNFKKQWGARPEPLVWQSFNSDGHLQPERHLDPRRHRLLAALWRRLPVVAATRLGPLLRGRLAN
jgi:FemAB-related protein (PEP-CTERM system-associated)